MLQPCSELPGKSIPAKVKNTSCQWFVLCWIFTILWKMFWKRHILSQFFFFLKNFFFLQKNDLNFHPNFATIAYTVEGCSRFFSFHILNICQIWLDDPHFASWATSQTCKKERHWDVCTWVEKYEREQ